MEFVERAINATTIAVERALAVGLIAAISLNFVNVIGRYLGGFTLTGVDEIEIYILIWISFLGAAVVTWRNEHLRMDVLLGACPAFVRKGVVFLETCVMLAIAVFVAIQSFRYVERIYALGAVSDIAHVPTWIPHSAIFISFSAIAFIVVAKGLRKARRAVDSRTSELAP